MFASYLTEGVSVRLRLDTLALSLGMLYLSH